ncbi:LysR family transcriptional regulator [Mangrovicoccus ximenensis]|uniref:LysR family transcriptional regulator n=1 Tax=Mangrovicoccus ximenensis TaxID=1911570 RepID=UPI0013750E5F|nr:LysR family transcriptional regulator [Mangrovicoccus ximenensis]
MRRFVPSHAALLAFESAARHMSFTRAAEDLAITQSGISRQISSLETLLGVRLFERAGSRLILTEPARAYLAEVTAALDMIERASVNCVRGATLEDALRICVHPTFASRWLAPRLSRFLAANPDTVVDLESTVQDLDFGEARIDIAILRGRGAWARARAQELFREELAVVAALGIGPAVPPAGVIDFDSFPSLQNASRPDLWLTGWAPELRKVVRDERRWPMEFALKKAREAGAENQRRMEELADRVARGLPIGAVDEAFLARRQEILARCEALVREVTA